MLNLLLTPATSLSIELSAPLRLLTVGPPERTVGARPRINDTTIEMVNEYLASFFSTTGLLGNYHHYPREEHPKEYQQQACRQQPILASRTRKPTFKPGIGGICNL